MVVKLWNIKYKYYLKNNYEWLINCINIYFRDLCFKKGDMIILRQKVDSNWYQGEANGVIGIFPLSYVQVSFI